MRSDVRSGRDCLAHRPCKMPGAARHSLLLTSVLCLSHAISLAQTSLMFFRPAIFALFTLFIFASGMGCKKSESAAHAAPPTVLSQDTIASVHWVGKGQLDLKADACFFSRIWSLPETERLQAQTFDHFSTGVWRFLLGDAAAAKMPAAVLRPLLDDLAQEEVYLEVRAPTNSQPSQVCLAIHVDIRRAGIWETKLLSPRNCWPAAPPSPIPPSAAGSSANERAHLHHLDTGR